MDANLTLIAIARHLDDARREAAEFDAAGCYGLARCRRRDVAYLEGLLSRFTADAGRQIVAADINLTFSEAR